MNHRYIRAYMAGIAAPTVFLLVVMTGFTIARYVYNVPIPIERVVVFPMALIPNLWGLWNMLYVWLGDRRRLPIGLHGALLIVLIAPAGLGLARLLGFQLPFQSLSLLGPATALVVYYLVWKYVVSFLDRLQEIL